MYIGVFRGGGANASEFIQPISYKRLTMIAGLSSLAHSDQNDLFSPVQVSSFGPNPTVYLSARLDLLQLPDDYGSWFGWMDDWYHKLDADWFVWLRQRIKQAAEAGRLTDEFKSAESIMAGIERYAVDHGLFSSVEIDIPRPAIDPWTNFPHHLNHEYFKPRDLSAIKDSRMRGSTDV
jgi:hypothetical protein